MEIKQYQKIQKAFEGANKSMVELFDAIGGLNQAEPLFSDIEIDLNSCESVLLMQQSLRRMETDFNNEFIRVRSIRLEESKGRILEMEPEPEEAQEQLTIAEESKIDDLDPLMEEAKEFVIEEQRASVSQVQRRLKIGYNRASRIIESLQATGVISEAGDNGQRKVLIQAG